MARGAVVVILSDGWDRGDPDAWPSRCNGSQRVAHRIVWVNPLKVTPGYAPLARGMAAAMPHIDASSRATRWPRWSAWPRCSRDEQP